MPARLLAATLLAAALAPAAEAQQRVGPLDVRGSVGFTGEAYASSGPERRAPGVLRLFANTQFGLFGLSSGFDLSYSTDQSQLRQNLNRVAFSTRWRWGSAAAGDVSPSISAYTLSGTVLRGGYLELAPGPLRVALGGGRAQRAATAEQAIAGRGQAYERYVVGGRLGVGDRQRTHLHLVGVYGRDDVSSVDRAEGVDDPIGVEPAENLVLAPEAGVLLMGGDLFVRGALAASAYTFDLRSPAGGPSFPLLTTRAGTSVDYSGELGARLDRGRMGLTLDASRYQPGFRTMGVPRFRADEQTVRGRLRLGLLRASRLSLTLGGSHARDNLLETNAVTVTRTTASADAAYRLSERASLSGGMALLTTSADPTAGTPAPGQVALDFASQSYRLAPVVALGRAGGTQHTVSANASYQTSRDRSAAVAQGQRADNRTDNLSAALAYTLAPPAGPSVTATLNGVRGETATSRMDVLGVTLGSGLSFWERRLTVSGTVGASQNRSRLTPLTGASASEQTLRQYTAGLTAGYRLFGSDQVRLTVRALSTETPEQAFREVRAALRYSHAF